MIAANELRIGNLLLDFYKNEIVVVSPALIKLFYEIEQNGNFQQIHVGIPLTKEWLKRFGFSAWKDYYALSWGSGFKIRKSRDGDYFIEDRTTAKVEYVHQLQNIYFALTGEELKYTA